MPESETVLLGDLCLLPSLSPPAPSPWTLGLGAAWWGEGGREGQGSRLVLGEAAQRGPSRQELQQQKRAQKSGDPEPGLQKEARETEKPQPAQESALRPGSTARAHRTHKANNTSAGEPNRGLSHLCLPALGTLKVMALPRAPPPPSGRAAARKEAWPLLPSLGPACFRPGGGASAVQPPPASPLPPLLL